MTNNDLSLIKKRFLAYADAFIARADNPFALELKKKHTLRVVEEMNLLIKDLGLAPDLCPTLEAAALLHDLGRFPQFETYGTFLDRVSVNHAKLSLSEIQTHGFLNRCTPQEQQLITTAVGHHNEAFIPKELPPKEALHLKMLRDADKLDIWQVVIHHYQNPEAAPRGIINLGLKEEGGFSKEALSALFQNTFVKSPTIKNINDLKLMQISWVFDLNFSSSVCRAKKREVVTKIAATMPTSQELSRVLDHVNRYMEKTCINCH